MDIKVDINSAFIAFRGFLIRAVSRIAPPKDVEDIVQEAYVKACQAEKKQDIKYHRAYLLKTARNLALDYVKSAEFRYCESMDEAELDDLLSAEQGQDTTYAQVVAEEEFARFCEAVRYLPEQCRRAFVLKKVYGYSQREIAKFMGITEKTVEKHIAMGMKRCTYFLSLSSSSTGDKQARQGVELDWENRS
ncbi:MAG: sigma-70 family RNA polymerase sigma factor [Anaerolineaceae bacterium]|nr:sigma-70 family RNA polymerase sigma factor [Anaerolineaceae bacterium]